MSQDKSKKRKREAAADVPGTETRKARIVEDAQDGTPTAVTAKKSKGESKQAKSERRSKKIKTKHDNDKPQDKTSHKKSGPTTTLEKKSDISKAVIPPPEITKPDSSKKGKSTTQASSRFIVFVGNLPYDASTEQIKTHFSKLAPVSVRHGTDKATGKSKGFAFVEFDGYDKMKTCLKLYHHSIFDPSSPSDPTETPVHDEDDAKDKKKGRRINVELTAGGGGKSKDRKEKITQKNQKLGEERERRRVKEKLEQEKAVQEKRDHPGTGANSRTDQPQDNRGSIHPSRMSRVQH